MKFKQSACIETLYLEIPFLDRFEAAKNDGFGGVEFWSWIDKDLSAIRSAAEDAEITICGFNGDAELSLVDPEHNVAYLEFLKKSIDAAKEVGSNSLTIHSNGLGEGGIVLNHYEKLSDTVKTSNMFYMLNKCTELAETENILLNLEGLNVVTDHVGNYLVNTSVAAEMCRMINSDKFKILYDVYHMQLNEGNLCNNITAYFDVIGHVHVADCPGRNEPGTGEIFYPRIYKALKDIGYSGYIGYELFPKTTTKAAVEAIMNIY